MSIFKDISCFNYPKIAGGGTAATILVVDAAIAAFWLVVLKKCWSNFKGQILTHYHTIPHFDTLKMYGCGKTL